MSATMNRVPHGGQIELTHWEYLTGDDPTGGFFDVIMKGFAAQVTEITRKVFEEEPPSLGLPFGWGPDSDGIGGKGPDDPVTLYLTLQLGEDDEGVTFACSLEEVIDDLIDNVVDLTGKVAEAEDKVICGKVANRLRELAQKIDDACKDTKTK